MIKAIIFDIDGVLIHGKMFSEILEADHGITREQTLPFFTGIFQQCLIGNADLRTELAPLLPQWGWKESIDAFLEYWFTSEQKLDRRLLEYIEKIKQQGVHVFVATNQEKHRTAHLWENLGLSKIFQTIFSSAHVGHLKHTQAFYEHIMQKLPHALDKKDVMLWDDTQKNIDAAKAFGIHAEFYSSFEDFKIKMDTYLRN